MSWVEFHAQLFQNIHTQAAYKCRNARYLILFVGGHVFVCEVFVLGEGRGELREYDVTFYNHVVCRAGAIREQPGREASASPEGRGTGVLSDRAPLVFNTEDRSAEINKAYL